jgi:hypothetical protein
MEIYHLSYMIHHTLLVPAVAAFVCGLAGPDVAKLKSKAQGKLKLKDRYGTSQSF